ncbi:MAG TPA: TrmH family RNA methyltransferase [Pseudonocardiaceae bacterium]|nr:TrmH family RNA methyltransferase [Pseudonocardiaceae bacterium]
MELKQIGVHHPKIKQVLAIQRNTAPNPRRMIIAEGLWAHNLLLGNGAFIDTFLWCPEAAYGDEARTRAAALAERAHLAYQVSEKTLARISERDRPDGLFSIAQLPLWEPQDVRLGESALIMVADGMEIPGNLGTLIRTLDAAAADCLVLTNRRTRLTHPKVFRASQGMVLKMPVLDFERVEDAATWLRRNDVNVYLADTNGAKNYRSFNYSSARTAFVLGSERHGIPKPWYEARHDRVFIPMLGSADSLNVSISAAVLLFEARAQKSHW